MHRVHADEGLREAGARDRHERAVERRRDRLGEHRLAGAGRAEEQHAALALAAGLLELLARLPERDHARDLLLGLGLAADVLELDAPVRVARLVALDLLDAEEHQRPEQDQEVDQEQRSTRMSAQLRRRRRGRSGIALSTSSIAAPRLVALEDARSRARRSANSDAPEDTCGGTSCASTRAAAARSTSSCAQLGLGAVDRRRRDQLVREHVDQPAEDHDGAEARRAAHQYHGPARTRREHHEEDRAGQQRDSGRRRARAASTRARARASAR